MKLFKSTKEEDQKITKAILFLFGFEPVNINLYKLALLHKSKKKNESNERLEYLGDGVLNLIVAEYLFKKYPYKDEGFLTKTRSKIVSRESLNNIGRKIGLKELKIPIKKDARSLNIHCKKLVLEYLLILCY